MDLESINAMWERDSKIDDVLLDEASIKIPQLHQKYLTLYSEYTLLSKKQSQKLKTLHHYKFLYYSGKAPPEEYEEKPFPHKVMKADVYNWVGIDEDVQKVELKLEYYNTVLKVLEEILKQVHQLSFNIKNMIQWRCFVSGT